MKISAKCFGINLQNMKVCVIYSRKENEGKQNEIFLRIILLFPTSCVSVTKDKLLNNLSHTKCYNILENQKKEILIILLP